MSSVWKIGLFEKFSGSEAKCLVCSDKIIQTKGGNTKGLIKHLPTHKEYEAKFNELESKKTSQAGAIEKFVTITAKGWFCNAIFFYRFRRIVRVGSENYAFHRSDESAIFNC